MHALLPTQALLELFARLAPRIRQNHPFQPNRRKEEVDIGGTQRLFLETSADALQQLPLKTLRHPTGFRRADAVGNAAMARSWEKNCGVGLQVIPNLADHSRLVVPVGATRPPKE